MEYKDGTYQGGYKSDLMDGYGVFRYRNGVTYEGEWRLGVK
jgi:MORN repeat